MPADVQGEFELLFRKWRQNLAYVACDTPPTGFDRLGDIKSDTQSVSWWHVPNPL